MSAAEGLAALEKNAALVKRAKLIGWAVLAVAVLALGYCAGTRHEAKQAANGQLAQLRVEHRTIVDTIRQVERRLVVDTQHVRVATAKADTARAKFDTAAREVLAVADTAAVVPSALVVPAIHVCQQMAVADSGEMAALRAHNADLGVALAAQTARADNDEAQAKVFKRPTLGLRSGLVIGATVALAVTNPAQVVKLGKFLIGLVR